MNFGEKENFYEKHRYFFQGYSFKFEGLKPSLQTKFENVVTKLSGMVCNDALYTLCDESYFDRLENQKRADLFSINFILDSIMANDLLNIEIYRYTSTNLQQIESPCCLISKYVLRTYSCLRYYQENVRCERCCSFDNNKHNDDTNSKLCKKSKDKDETENVYQEELTKCNNEEINSIDEVEEIIQRKRKHAVVEILSPKKNKLSTVQINEDKKDVTEKRRRKAIIYVGDNAWKRVDVNHPMEQENIADNMDNSPEIQTKWWTCLPPPSQSKSVKERMYEKGERRRGHDYSMNEKRQMIAYLIMRNKINDCRMRDPWRQMQAEGYLSNRSVESLHNHFRKSILPNIHKFGLPEDIVLKF
ncbi:uncharacterized protein LOC100677843 isoform X2 [Nasonia vitripennis]|uniref:Repressor/activator protein 1 homolog n=1 Tax=Nasonia vitripennis TaxID=7425 RepID=A0A7M7H699_NASVI|nr:uncharacterized protein LOC100677843 isoform X2 [Nasonia vitripennis]